MSTLSSTPTAPILEARGVSKRFAGVAALSDVTFTVEPGDSVALMGENGAGKSTLIKVLTGVYQPDGGEILFQNAPVQFAQPSDAQRAGISTIYQEVNLIPLMTVAQNIFLGREPRNRLRLIDHRALRRNAKELLTAYGITVDVNRQLRTLPLGIQQMVALARAVSINARVVIMDEPTSSLEAREVETLFQVIERLRASGIAIVYVSHRMDEIYRVCDTVAVLRDGELVHTGRLDGISRTELVSLMLGRTFEKTVRAAESAEHKGASTAPPVLAARDITRRHEIDDIDLTVKPGEIVGLGGLLGSGRSETLKALAGVTPVDRGTVDVQGRAVRTGSIAASIRAGVVMLPEDRKAEGIIPGMSVRDNIVLAALPRLSRGGFVSTDRQDAVVDIFMNRLRIKAASPDQLVSELSGGNQQKVMIARLLAMSPKVLLLDEPTRGIDVGAKAEVQTLVDELAREGLAIVLVSSEVEEVIEGADRIVVLRDGRIGAELTGAEIDGEHLLAAMAGDSAADLDPEIAIAAVDPDAAVRFDAAALDLASSSRPEEGR